MDSRMGKWLKMRLVSSLLLVSIGMLPGKIYQPVIAKEILIEAQVEHGVVLNDPQPASMLDPKTETELLNRTVQIKMYTRILAVEPMSHKIENGAEKYLLTSGLGSLVVWQGKYVLVTHNHWGEGLNQAEYITIHDWHGKVLRTIEKDKFMNLILYSDPGTLVLYDPTATWVSVGHLGEEMSVATGDIVAIAHQDPVNSGNVALMQAKVVDQRQNNGLAVIGVSVMGSGTIIAGDSGGGVWLDGELIGNTWAVENTRDQAISSGSGLIAQLPKISIESQDEAAEIQLTPISISSDPMMW